MFIIDLELNISVAHDGQFSAGMRVELPTHRVDLANSVPITLNYVALRALATMPEAYGAALSAMLFNPDLRMAWQEARAFAAGAGGSLRVRLSLDGDDDLHGLHWELLRDPVDGIPLAHSEHIRFSRFLSSPSLAAIQPVTRSSLHAVVAVANPPVLPELRLQPVDVAGEVRRAQASLGDARVTMLDGQAGRPAATLPAIVTALRDVAHVLYLVCHGALVGRQPYLWLEPDAERRSRPVAGDDLVRALLQLEQRPVLVILATCAGAGDDALVLAALGPRIARVGIGAVLAMRGQVPLTLVDAFIPRLFAELLRDGQIDRAVAAARSALPADSPWWLPTLWMTVRDGALWRPDPDAAAPGQAGLNAGTVQMVTVTGGSVGSIIGSQHNS